MFSFGQRNKLVAVRTALQRVVNLSSPNLLPFDGEARSDPRNNRSIPVVLALWENDAPVLAEVITAVTKDVSDRGVAVLLRQPLRVDRLVVGLWAPSSNSPPDRTHGHPLILLGDVRQSQPLGGGFWQVGIEAIELLTPAHCPAVEALLPLIANLAPPSPVAQDLPTVASIR